LLSHVSPWLPKWKNSERKLEGLILETVKRAPFQITAIERGFLDSMKNAVLTSKVEGSNTIISIVPEGTHVKEGDLICELDSSALVDKETQQQIAVTTAKALLDTAQENVEIQNQQNASDIAAAELALTLAELDLKKFTLEGGDYDQQRRALLSQVTLMKDKLQQSEELEAYTERLVKKGFKTQNELVSIRITKQSDTINLKLAEDQLYLLEKFTKERTLKELEANAVEFGREVERVKLKAKSALNQKESERDSRLLAHKIEIDRLERLQAQIKACKIYAPQDGQVIYVNQRDGRSSDQVLIEEGATVRERQQIVTLPDLSEMKVNARVHESRISLMRTGLPVTVKVDAFPDETFRGQVSSVASVPSSTGSSYMRDIKEYEAVIRLMDDESKVSKLRPGLTAQLEVLVESRDDVLQAPIQSVLNVVGKPVAFAVVDGRVQRRDVQVGQTNERVIEILSGLNEGDRVVMNPRTHFEKEIKELEAELIKKNAEQPQLVPEVLPNPVETPPGVPGDIRPTGANPPGGERLGPTGGSPGSGGGGRPFDPVARFQQQDANGDGKLTPDEWSERMKDRAPGMDTDGDGAVSLEEYKTAMANFTPGGGAGGGQRPRNPPPVGGSE
jgi:HlyD family secretion protein